MIYVADQHVTQWHGRGTGVIVLAVSVLALLFFGAVAFNFRGFAYRVPWRGGSSDRKRQADVVLWNRVLSAPWIVVAVVTLITGLRLVINGSP